MLGHLYAQLGRESGLLLRRMHRAGISWGTYVDAMCHEGQWHCNAHTNNVVVLSEAQVPESWISAQDRRPLFVESVISCTNEKIPSCMLNPPHSST